MARTAIILLIMALMAAAAAPAAEKPVAEIKIALSSDTSLVAESGIGDLVADALAAALRADLALVNGSALRMPYTLEQGPVGEAALKGALAYPDEKLGVLELQGSTLRAAIERSLSLLPKPNKGFLQISGIQVWYDPTKPSGQRVSMIEHHGTRLAPDRTYRVVMPNSLAKGGLGYFRIFNGAKYEPSETTMAEALIAYAKATKVIELDPAKEQRYRVVGQ
jgi:5'-nucleotidase/UDP-sugar diphosphatase